MESSSSADEEDKFLEEALEGFEALDAEERAESEGSCSSLLHQSISALRSEIAIYSYPFVGNDTRWSAKLNSLLIRHNICSHC